MCGIFGVATKNIDRYKTKDTKKIIEVLFKLSESRGKEAAGLAAKTADSINILKLPINATRFLKSLSYQDFFNSVFNEKQKSENQKFLTIIGHSRLATHGTEYNSSNNQPVVKENAAAVHNGIIVNDKYLWQKFTQIKKEFEVDTEVFLSLFQLFLSQTKSISAAIRKVFEIIEGSASVAMLFNNNHLLVLATNTGSIYFCENKAQDVFVFASERYILEEFINRVKKIDFFNKDAISQLLPGRALTIEVNTLNKKGFQFLGKDIQSDGIAYATWPAVKFVDYSNFEKEKFTSSAFNVSNKYHISTETKKSMQETWGRLYSGDKLKRCKKCLLPETMTFINFDDKGICNYCRNHKKNEVKGEEALEEIVAKYRRKDGKPDCIVPFSGGRDSSYGLHYVKNVLKMNPIAYTYDWGVMTDLGRRNEARLCGKMGVEHIIISADIRRKRENIRKNLNAWLKRPQLGMVPLLMAGDKMLWQHAEWLKKKTNIKLAIYSYGNKFEQNLFKIGFSGVYLKRPESFQNLSIIDKIKTTKYYTAQFILNHSYINRSILDTLFAYYSVFIVSNKDVYLFDYVKWDEKEILSTIINNYNWETGADTKATWRIDDGTAAFYNYVYMTVAGFTEFDTFRSTQIREGCIARDEAYKLIKEENKPRFDSIEWYSRIIGFDVNGAIEKINSMPKLYKV